MQRTLSVLGRRGKAILKKVFGILPREALTGVKIRSSQSLLRFGSGYASWVVPFRLLNQDSICYSLGVGEDISFDLDLIKRVGCNIFAYDPTPRAIVYAQKWQKKIPNFHFQPMGVWDKTEIMKFYAPVNREHVSHSILNIQKTSTYFEASCKRLSTLMKENGHSKIDLLKMDIEGAEYTVLDSILDDGLKIPVICVEFDELHHPVDEGYKERIKKSIRRLVASGYDIVCVEQSNYTFLLKKNLRKAG
jgi:FkbM family methyltransferase